MNPPKPNFLFTRKGNSLGVLWELGLGDEETAGFEVFNRRRRCFFSCACVVSSSYSFFLREEKRSERSWAKALEENGLYWLQGPFPPKKKTNFYGRISKWNICLKSLYLWDIFVRIFIHCEELLAFIALINKRNEGILKGETRTNVLIRPKYLTAQPLPLRLQRDTVPPHHTPTAIHDAHRSL